MGTGFCIFLLIIIFLALVFLVLNTAALAQYRDRVIANWITLTLIAFGVIFIILFVIIIFWALWDWWTQPKATVIHTTTEPEKYFSFGPHPGSVEGTTMEQSEASGTVVSKGYVEQPMTTSKPPGTIRSRVPSTTITHRFT
jgi:hypothetical protein